MRKCKNDVIKSRPAGPPPKIALRILVAPSRSFITSNSGSSGGNTNMRDKYIRLERDLDSNHKRSIRRVKYSFIHMVCDENISENHESRVSLHCCDKYSNTLFDTEIIPILRMLRNSKQQRRWWRETSLTVTPFSVKH